MNTFIKILFTCILMTSASQAAEQALTDQETAWMKKASRKNVNGWLWVKIQGAPFERGFQHGYLLAREYAEAMRVYKAMTLHTTGMDYSFFSEQAAKMHKPLITPELIEDRKSTRLNSSH